MDQDTPVILVFDSGLGGTTILNHTLARKIRGPFISVADNKFLPYGQQKKRIYSRESFGDIFKIEPKIYNRISCSSLQHGHSLCS
jgi:glutamate racemase